MNNINIQITPDKNYKKTKIIIILTSILILLVSELLTAYYSEKNSSLMPEYSAHDIVSDMNDSISDYHVFENDDGYVGVADKLERVVIEPVWKNISILPDKRYIASVDISENIMTGIIDENSNVIVPFIFEHFRTLNSEYMAGYINDENFILFDKNGNKVSEKCWTDYSYSDNVMHLRDGMDEYRLTKQNGVYNFVYIDLYRTPGSIPMNIVINNSEEINEVGVDGVERIAYITDKYLNYLIAGGTGYDISDITTEQYLPTLSVNDMFRECKISSISNFEIEKLSENKSSSYNIKVIVKYDYSTSEINLENISSEITLNIAKDDNNRLILKSINKVEL